MDNKSLTVLIPLYNKEKLIKIAVSQTVKLVKDLDYEIIVIENESTDNSKQEIEKYIKNCNDNVKLISTKKGLGNALKAGIESSSKKYLTCIPADFSTGTSEISFFKNASDFEYVISSRTHPLSNSNQKIQRTIISKVYNFLKKILLNLNYQDTQFSFIIKTDIAKVLSLECRSSRFFITTELVYYAVKNRIKVKEIPIEIHEQVGNVTTVKVLRDSLKILFEMLMLFKREGRLK